VIFSPRQKEKDLICLPSKQAEKVMTSTQRPAEEAVVAEVDVVAVAVIAVIVEAETLALTRVPKEVDVADVKEENLLLTTTSSQVCEHTQAASPASLMVKVKYLRHHAMMYSTTSCAY
jgi:hypothetical protein